MDYPTPDQVDAATAPRLEAWAALLPSPKDDQERAVFDRVTARRLQAHQAHAREATHA